MNRSQNAPLPGSPRMRKCALANHERVSVYRGVRDRSPWYEAKGQQSDNTTVLRRRKGEKDRRVQKPA